MCAFACIWVAACAEQALPLFASNQSHCQLALSFVSNENENNYHIHIWSPLSLSSWSSPYISCTTLCICIEIINISNNNWNKRYMFYCCLNHLNEMHLIDDEIILEAIALSSIQTNPPHRHIHCWNMVILMKSRKCDSLETMLLDFIFEMYSILSICMTLSS